MTFDDEAAGRVVMSPLEWCLFQGLLNCHRRRLTDDASDNDVSVDSDDEGEDTPAQLSALREQASEKIASLIAAESVTRLEHVLRPVLGLQLCFLKVWLVDMQDVFVQG
jgi:hypothetical protein